MPELARASRKNVPRTDYATKLHMDISVSAIGFVDAVADSDLL
jgi:hypothetical protein